MRRRTPNEFFDGFPYELTRVSPSLFHLLVLPAELPFGHLKEIVRWQAEANSFPSCLVLGPDECVYFGPDGSEAASEYIPRGGVQVAGFLWPCCQLPATAETMARLELAVWIAGQPKCLPDDPLRGGRPATAEEVARLGGKQGRVPNGLACCANCGEFRGECRDPRPGFHGLVIPVHCRCENDCLCARCGRPLYERKVNANYFRNGALWHVPGFACFEHRCGEESRVDSQDWSNWRFQ